MRDKQAIFAVLAVLVVVGLFIGGANYLTRPKDTTPAASDTAAPTEAEPTGGATSSPTSSTATSKLLAGCTAVPKAASSPPKVSGTPDLAAAKGKTFTIVMTTTCGKITGELYGAKAPAATSSFILLAKDNYYANSPCHRLVTTGIYVLQCGDPTGTGSGAGPGYHYGVENVPSNDVYPRGTIAMARKSGDPNSNSDQFFIVYKDTTLPKSGDGNGYTIVGKVTSGLDVVDKIAAAGVNPTDQTSPLAPIGIVSMSVTQKAA